MTNKHFTFHKLQNVIKSSLLLEPGMELGMVNEMKHGTQIEPAMERGHWNMQWKIEWNIEWNLHSDFIWPILSPYMVVITNPKIAFILPISGILALIFPILLDYFTKCEGKCS